MMLLVEMLFNFIFYNYNIMDGPAIASIVISVIGALFYLLNGLKCVGKRSGGDCESSCTKGNSVDKKEDG